jgi:hypothetical protein
MDGDAFKKHHTYASLPTSNILLLEIPHHSHAMIFFL